MSVLVYRRQMAGLILRLLSVLFIFLLIRDYRFVINRDVPGAAPVFIIDQSKSMEHSLADIRDVISRFPSPQQVFFINESLLLHTEPERSGSYTDLGRAIREADAMEPSAIVLVTDGNHNFGASPLALIDQVKVPVIACGVGADTARDVAISDIDVPAYAHPGDSIRIDVTIESRGFRTGNGRAVLKLLSGERLATRTFPLADAPAKSTLTFRHYARSAGTQRLIVQVDPEPDEISYDNNAHGLHVDILDTKIRVLYYTDHVSFNTKFILEALSADRNIELAAMIGQGSNGRWRSYEGADLTAPLEIAAFDVIVLDNTNVSHLPWNGLPRMLDQGKGIVVIGSADGLDEKWRNIMPINAAGKPDRQEQPVLVAEPFSVLAPGEYPPARITSRILGSKSDATIIARMADMPVIGFRRHAKGVVFQICLQDLGTWNFLQRGLRNKDILGGLMSDVVRFSSPLRAHSRLALSAENKDHVTGKAVPLLLQSYDRDFRIAGSGDFFLVTGGSKIPFYEVSRGRYESEITFANAGRQAVYAQGELNGEVLVSDTLEIDIAPRSVESEYGLNRELLMKIAERTSGRFIMLQDLENTTRELAGAPRTTVSTTVSTGSPVLCFVALAMLIGDWVRRRRQGIT